MTANARFFISLGVVGLGLACGVRSHRSRHWGASIGHTAEMNYASIGQDSAYFAGAQVAAAGVRPVCAGSPADGGPFAPDRPRMEAACIPGPLETPRRPDIRNPSLDPRPLRAAFYGCAPS